MVNFNRSPSQQRRISLIRPTHSYPLSSWQKPYLSALTETDEKRLVELVHATEGAMFRRWQELANSTDHHEERSDMEVASAVLLSVKTHKLGWPGFQIK